MSQVQVSGIWLLTNTACWEPWRHGAVGMCLFFTSVSPLPCSCSAVSRDFKTLNNKGKIPVKILQQVPVNYKKSDFLTNLMSMPPLFCHPVAYKQLSWTDVKLLMQQFLNTSHNSCCVWFLLSLTQTQRVHTEQCCHTCTHTHKKQKSSEAVTTKWHLWQLSCWGFFAHFTSCGWSRSTKRSQQ